MIKFLGLVVLCILVLMLMTMIVVFTIDHLGGLQLTTRYGEVLNRLVKIEGYGYLEHRHSGIGGSAIYEMRKTNWKIKGLKD